MYKYRDYIVRDIEDSDLEVCRSMLGSDVRSTSNGVVIEYNNEIIGFATYEIEEGIVSVPVGFIKHYVVKKSYRGTKASWILAMVLIVEKMSGYSIYTSSANAKSFRGMVQERPVSGRTNKVFKIYRVKTSIVMRLYEHRKKIKWEVSIEQ